MYQKTGAFNWKAYMESLSESQVLNMETGRSSKGAGVCILLLLMLKILGIILLVLLGSCFWYCAVLFVPVRYQISGSWKEKWGRVRVSPGCFFGDLRKQFLYEREGLPGICCQVLWLKLWSSGEEEQTGLKRK